MIPFIHNSRKYSQICRESKIHGCLGMETEKQKGRMTKGHKKTLGSDVCFHYLDSSEGFMVYIHGSNFIKVYMLNTCSLLYVNYTSVKLLNSFSLFIYFERERERAWAGKGQREGERKNPKQAPHCLCGAQCRARTRKLRPWPELKSRVEHSTHWPIQVPRCLNFFDFQKETNWHAWMAQLVKCPTLGFGPGHDLTVHEFKPCH